PDSPYEIQLDGNDPPPSIVLSPGTLSFDTQGIGSTSAPMSVAVTNDQSRNLVVASVSVSGTNAGDFSATTDCIGQPVLPQGSCTISVVFSPTALGAESG